MIAARGVLTAKGGATSHAAVVARGMGKPCVAGCETLTDRPPHQDRAHWRRGAHEGDWLTIDGTTGNVCRASFR